MDSQDLLPKKMDTVTFDPAIPEQVPQPKSRRSSKTSPSLKGKKRSASLSEPPPLELIAATAATAAAAEAPVQLPEPLLTESENGFTLFPVKYPDVFKKGKEQISVIWTVEEIDTSKDMAHWDALSDNER